MTVKEKMKNGMLYCCGDEELMREQTQCLEKLYDFNQTRPSEADKRAALLKELFAEVGEGCYVEPPPACQLGLQHPFRPSCLCKF